MLGVGIASLLGVKDEGETKENCCWFAGICHVSPVIDVPRVGALAVPCPLPPAPRVVPMRVRSGLVVLAVLMEGEETGLVINGDGATIVVVA